MSWTDLPDGVNRRITSLVRDGITSHNRRVRRGRIVTATVVGASLVVGGTASTALVLAGQSERARTAYCYSDASLTSDQEQMSLPPEMIASSGDDAIVRAQQRAAMAEDLCGALWRSGVFSPTGTPTDPDLAVCEANDGVLATLPKFDGVSDARLCEEVGLLALVR